MNDLFWIGGKHAVLEASKQRPNDVKELLISNPDNLRLIKKSLHNLIKITENKLINNKFKNKLFNHQGFAARIKMKTTFDFMKLKKDANNIDNILILNTLFDDRNIGSIFRSSAAFGINNIILSKRDFRPKSEMLYRVSTGAVEHMNIFLVSNINQTIKLLKSKNFWVYGLDSDGTKSIFNENFDKKNCFIVGSEGDGIKSLVKKNCDELIKIPIDSSVESLNVSNAVAILLAQIKKNPPINWRVFLKY